MSHFTDTTLSCDSPPTGLVTPMRKAAISRVVDAAPSESRRSDAERWLANVEATAPADRRTLRQVAPFLRSRDVVLRVLALGVVRKTPRARHALFPRLRRMLFDKANHRILEWVCGAIEAAGRTDQCLRVFTAFLDQHPRPNGAFSVLDSIRRCVRHKMPPYVIDCLLKVLTEYKSEFVRTQVLQRLIRRDIPPKAQAQVILTLRRLRRSTSDLLRDVAQKLIAWYQEPLSS